MLYDTRITPRPASLFDLLLWVSMQPRPLAGCIALIDLHRFESYTVLMVKAVLLITLFIVNARLSWYHPATCSESPINCFDSAVWWHTASGEDARHWYWRGLACPSEYAMGTRFVINGSRWGLADGEWICIDRGGMIITHDDGSITLDLLTDRPIWADVLPVQIVVKRVVQCERCY